MPDPHIAHKQYPNARFIPLTFDAPHDMMHAMTQYERLTNDHDADDMLECDTCHQTPHIIYADSINPTPTTRFFCAQHLQYPPFQLNALSDECSFLARTLMISARPINSPYYYEPALTIPDESFALDCDEMNENLDPTETPITHETARYIRLLIESLDRDSASQYALSLSLCPIHLIDYAICFDDNPAECAQIRKYFPSHDT
jgi:hypothetical protein